MMRRLERELKLTKPLDSLEQEAFLNVLRTSGALTHGLLRVLRPAGLSPTQYNVLRILRGAGAEGLTCSEISERLIGHDPDVTRLLDRMETRGLVDRHRPSEDRRVVRTAITMDGWKVLEGLDPKIRKLHNEQLGHLGSDRLRQLVELLELARGADGEDPE